MKLDEVTQVKTLKVETEVNEYLSKGYRIIKILSTKTSTDFSDEIQPVFILGLVKAQ